MIFRFEPWQRQMISALLVSLVPAAMVIGVWLGHQQSLPDEPPPVARVQATIEKLLLPNGASMWFVESESGDRCMVVERKEKVALDCAFKEEK